MFNDVSFVLQPGEVVGNLGRNGSGKTTTADADGVARAEQWEIRVPAAGSMFTSIERVALADRQYTIAFAGTLALISGSSSLMAHRASPTRPVPGFDELPASAAQRLGLA